jgi:deoxycytidylate deaminase
MYTVYLPCSSCAKVIAGNEIREVVYSMIYSEPDSLTKEMFAESGIKLRKLEIDLEKQFQRIRNIKNQAYSKKVR